MPSTRALTLVLLVRLASCILLQDKGDAIVAQISFIWDLDDDSDGNY
jgi:hypothetical protein